VARGTESQRIGSVKSGIEGNEKDDSHGKHDETTDRNAEKEPLPRTRPETFAFVIAFVIHKSPVVRVDYGEICNANADYWKLA
jgi:hypothetical protein